MTSRVRLAIVRDFRAEGWPSMDLCADQLLLHLPSVPAVIAADLEVPFRRRFQRIPIFGRRSAAFNADRLLNRHLILPRSLHRRTGEFDFFHVVDHSYAHAVLALPPGRAGVYCHDLDAFRSLLEPEKEGRPWWFRRLARRTLDGLRRAAVVFHSTDRVAEQIRRFGLVEPGKLVRAPYGVASEFTSEPAVPVECPVPTGAPYLLHVGANIPRKRIDVLLAVFAAVRTRISGLGLVQVGGPWPPHLADEIARLDIGPAVTQLRGLTRHQLAELYRRAAAVLVTSDAEGFGLPVIEALACGAAVVASDIPVLREVGGAVVGYCPVADVPAWTETIARVVGSGAPAAPRHDRLAHAARYSWAEHARIIGGVYERLARGLPPK